MSDNKNYEKKLILNYTSLTRLARKEPLENFPIIVNKYYPELIPQYLVLYSEKEFYDMDNSAVCFYLYDEKFNGQHGLWNSIYYDNQEDLTAFYERFKNVKIFIEPDISQVDSIEIIENKYRVFMNRVMGLWFIHQTHAWVIPNITFADRYSFKYMLLGIEECEVVAFSLKGSMEHSEDMGIYLDAIDYTVVHMEKLKAIIVFSTSKYDEKVLQIFKKAIDKGILIYIPNNTQKKLNCRGKKRGINMRINEYETFEQFYEEYNYDRDVFQEHYIGLEFKYANNYYRLGHDYSNDDSDHPYKYWVYELEENSDGQKIYLKSDWINVGQFKNLDDALDNWIIEGKPFREVIMLDDTQILGKD